MMPLAVLDQPSAPRTASGVAVPARAGSRTADDMRLLEILQRLHARGREDSGASDGPVPVDVGELVVSALQALSHELDEKRLALALDLAGSQVVVGCPQRLRSMVDGLLTDAVAAAPARGRLAVTLLDAGDGTRVVTAALGSRFSLRLPAAGSRATAAATG
jgi:hypothetical protein